jgi:hypothetical protein
VGLRLVTGITAGVAELLFQRMSRVLALHHADKAIAGAARRALETEL